MDLVDDGFGGRRILVDDGFVWTMPVCMDDRLLSEQFWWTTGFGGRCAFVWTMVDLYGRPITKRAILVDDGFWWTMRICMDDGRFVWTMVDLYGRPITKRVILVDDGFVWTTDY
jgi:hypothetical protein